MPHYSTQLLSYIDYEHYATDYTPLFHPPAQPDPELLADMKVIDWVGYAVNPKRTLRNQAVKEGARGKDSRRRMDVPLFRSEKEKEKTRKEREALSLEVTSFRL
jgi:PAB-dependent poly(A)-specific ribonuclease subunit 2